MPKQKHPIGSTRSLRGANRSLMFALWLVLGTLPGYPQSGGTTYYTYDDNGRLRGMIAPSGEGNLYEYDPAGNITAVRKVAADTLEVFDFSPRQGGTGAQVTMIGTGFSGVSEVSFNGTVAQIVSVNPPLLTVTVPAGARSGPIRVTTNRGTSLSLLSFTLRSLTVTPSAIEVSSNGVVQFAVAAASPDDEQVAWSVEGIEGGNAAVGTITEAGRYTAPRLPETQGTAIFRISATSLSDDTIASEASVTVRNPSFFSGIYSPPVSVFNGFRANFFSAPVVVQNGFAPNLFSSFVSVLNGPVMSAVSPTQFTRGATRVITVTGLNLTGVTEILFFDAVSGALVTDLVASGINVAPTGQTLTANLSVNSTAVAGRRFIVLKATAATPTRAPAGALMVEIIP